MNNTHTPDRLDSLCEIMLGEKIASPFVSRSGELLIPAGVKLTRSRISVLLSHSSVYLAEGFGHAESMVNAVLNS